VFCGLEPEARAPEQTITQTSYITSIEGLWEVSAFYPDRSVLQTITELLLADQVHSAPTWGLSVAVDHDAEELDRALAEFAKQADG
jgi:hypothetical protein